MKILGIAAEYNPFHNGHKYHIERSKEISQADGVVAVMSGNFTQRGEAAILDKWDRSRLAVENGVDLVIELPFVYACNRAEYFAKGAIDILKGLGAEVISFGSESGNIKALTETAEGIIKENERLEEKKTELMKTGLSSAKASELAVESILGSSAVQLITEPNNILAVEYIKRIHFWQEKGADIRAITIKRHGSGYHEMNPDTGFAGASAIRKMSDAKVMSRYVPANIYKELFGKEEGILMKDTAVERAHEAEKKLFEFIRSEIVRTSNEELGKIYCMGEGLENKLKKEIVRAGSMDELVSSIASKRYTKAAIRRLLIYLLLGIKRYQLPDALYARVLAASQKGRELISEIKKEGTGIPIITNINKQCSPCSGLDAIKYDLLCTDMYNLLYGRDMYKFSDKVVKPYIKGI